MQIGFSTGVLYRKEPDFNKLIKIYKSIRVNSLEIFFGQEKLLCYNIKIGNLKSFKHISIHAPTRNVIYKNDKKTKKILAQIEKIYKKLNAKFIVFHPDLVKDWKIFKNYSFEMAIENMDWRKPFGQTVKDIKRVLKNKKIKLALDVNHCYTNDKTLRLLLDFYKNFKDRICEIHMSGFNSFSEYHEPLCITKQNKFLTLIPEIKNFPIIIESKCTNKKGAEKELKYIKKFLSR